MADFSDEQKKFVDSTVEYLEANEVYDLFDAMTQELLLQQPENPIQFLIEYLSKPPVPKIVLISPPGACDSKRVAKKVADNYGVPLISAAGIESDALIEKLKASNKTGYVVEGFPSTRVETLKMLVKKVIPDKILLLRVSEETLLKRIELAGPGEEMSEEERNIRQFFRHVVGVLQLVGPQTYQIDIEDFADNQEKIAQAVIARVALKPHSVAPFTPHRVTISGPPASGRRELARELANIFGAVHVDVASLLRETAEKTPTLPVAKAIQTAMQTGELLADSLVCSLVEERLRHADCQSRGWVLDGFPINEAQATHLRAARLLPSRAVVLTTSAELVRENLQNKLTDPVTGAEYTAQTAAALEPTVRTRLVKSTVDSDPAIVERRVANVAGTAAAVTKSFPAITEIVPLGGDSKHTLDRVRDFVERPLSKDRQ